MRRRCSRCSWHSDELTQLPPPSRRPGTRLFASTYIAVVLNLPPSAMLFTQAVIMWLTHSSEYCRTALLTDALTQRRMLALAQGVDWAALPLVVLLPPAVLLTGNAPNGELPHAGGSAGAPCPALRCSCADGLRRCAPLHPLQAAPLALSVRPLWCGSQPWLASCCRRSPPF